jgi:hypothetical protein
VDIVELKRKTLPELHTLADELSIANHTGCASRS